MNDYYAPLPAIPGYVLPAVLARTLAAVCAPLPEEPHAALGPGGAALRYTPVFQAIRIAREEDDATLPRGEWTRPLKRADWHHVIALCAAALQDQSKDFQLAAWLSEAWAREYGADGVCAALILLESMIDHDWTHGHPSVAEGDPEARVGVFIWLRDALTAAMTRHYPLMVLGDRAITLDDWQRLLITVPVATNSNYDEDDEEDALSRDALIESAQGDVLLQLERLRESCVVALALLPAVVSKMDAAIGADAPSFERLVMALNGLQRAAVSLIDGRVAEGDPFVSTVMHFETVAGEEGIVLVEMQDSSLALALDHSKESADRVDARAARDEARQDEINDDGSVSRCELVSRQSGEDVDLPLPACASSSDASLIVGPSYPAIAVHGRQHAYLIIAALADYLSESEPHSPTPYLLRRAVTWGHMPLPELLKSIIEHDGDLNRFLSEVGIVGDRMDG